MLSKEEEDIHDSPSSSASNLHSPASRTSSVVPSQHSADSQASHSGRVDTPGHSDHQDTEVRSGLASMVGHSGLHYITESKNE